MPRRESPEACPTRAFAPEAHLPRSRRLIIGPVDVLIEVGVGVQHRFPWSECDAVLRFPDRLELVMGDTSVVIRASDWYQGTDALELADRLVPAELLVEVSGDPEPPLTPYRLDGLARHSSVVLATAAGACIAVSLMALTLSASDRRQVGVIIAALFLLPVKPLISAVRRRRSVPARWRQAAIQAPASRVRWDATLARTSSRNLVIARTALPVATAVGTVGWWAWTGDLGWFLLVIGGAAGSAVNLELRRRRHR